MAKLKKSLSLLISLLMILGMVVLPSPVSAEGKEEAKEAPYTIKYKDGKAYKAYKMKDVVGTQSNRSQMKSGRQLRSLKRAFTPMRQSPAEPQLGEKVPYKVDVQWTTYDLMPGDGPRDLGTPVYFQIYDSVSKKFIAQTKNVTARGIYEFYKLPAWSDSDVSHDTSDWECWAPEAYEFDIHLRTASDGSFDGADVAAQISQRGNPIYRAEYYTNKPIPSIEVQRTNKDDETDTVPINEKNLEANQYYSWAKAYSEEQQFFFRGKRLDIQKYGKDTLVSLQVSDKITAGRVKMYMKAPGHTEFDRGPGTFTDNGTPYHYEVTGDHIELHIFTIRQDLKVKFDPNGGSWKNSAPADQTIGHSMKLADSWAGMGPINVPGAGDLTPPTVEAGKPEKEFIGWNTDANATTALFTDNTYAQPITDDATFYAIYAEKAQGKAMIKYNLDGTAKKASEIDAKYKIAGKDYPTELTGNVDEAIANEVFDTEKAPKFLGYKIKSITTDPVPNPPATANYTKDGDYTVIYTYDKLPDIIPGKDDNGNDNPDVTPDVKDTYKKVTIKVDSTKGKFQKNNADVTGSEFLYYVNPVEGKTLDDVKGASGLTPKSNDENANKIDAAKPWKFTPDKTKADTPADVVLGTEVNKDNFKGVDNVVMEVNFKQTKADQLKDKLDPVDIKVWVDETDTDGSKIPWKEGVKLNDANKDDETLKGLLAAATVTDLGENGTIAQPGTARNSSKQNLPDGKKGNLKVAFDDGSALVVENQTLYVAPHKNDDNKNLPKDAVKVDFKIGEGVTGEAKTEYVKPGTDVKEDAPAVSAKTGYKDAKWYKGDAVATDDDYKVTANAVFTAKATGKDKVVKLDDPENPTNFPKDPTDNSKNDKDYVTVKFVADANGKIKEGEAEKAKGIAYAVLKNTEWKDAVTAGVVVPKADAEGDAPKLVGKDKFYSFKEWQKDGTKVTEFAKVGDADVTYTAVFGKADEFSVTYNLNAPEGLTVGGTAPTDTDKYLKDEQVTVKALAADNTLAGYKFNGWNTQADGKGTAYAAGSKFAIKANTELFAQWEKTAKDVIPVDNENDKKGKDGEEIPTNYVFVEFKVKDTDADKANIKDGQQAKFKVDPKVAVTLTAPALELKGDYKDSHIASFNKADYTKKVFAQATTIWANVTEKGKVTVNYVFNTNPADKTLPKALADLKPENITTPIYEGKVVAPAQPDVTKDPAKSALVEKDKDGKVIGTWTPGPWVRTGSVKEGAFTYSLTWTFEQERQGGGFIFFPAAAEEEKHETGIHNAYIFGYEDSTFRPEGNMTRAEAAAMLARLQGLDLSNKARPDFIDVRSGWYNSVINAVVNAGYMKGYPDGTFRPDGKITRAEFAQMIKAIDKANTSDMPFADAKGHWAEPAIAQAYANGRITGYPDGTFRPDNQITRAEAVTVFNKLYDRSVSEAGLEKVKADLVDFNDTNRSHWAYDQIVEASNTHEFYRTEKGKVAETWVKVIQTWKDLLAHR